MQNTEFRQKPRRKGRKKAERSKIRLEEYNAKKAVEISIVELPMENLEPEPPIEQTNNEADSKKVQTNFEISRDRVANLFSLKNGMFIILIWIVLGFCIYMWVLFANMF